jgi:hypothetical protein
MASFGYANSIEHFLSKRRAGLRRTRLGRRLFRANGVDAKPRKLATHFIDAARLVAIVLPAANTDKPPTKPFQDPLSVKVGGQLINRVVTIAIALDRDTRCSASHDKIDPKRTHLVLREQSIAPRDERTTNLELKGRLRARFNPPARTATGTRIPRMLDQPSTQILLLKIRLRIQGMNDPKLVACSACRHVVALLEILVCTV